MEFDPETRHDSETRRSDPARPCPDGGGAERGTDEPNAPTARAVSRLSTRTAVALQGRAGNRAVARLVAQRRTAAGQQGATARAGGAAVPARPGSSGAPATTSATPASAGPTEAVPVESVQLAADTVTRPGPAADPKFGALKRDVKGKQQTLRKHPPAKSEADAAGRAAKPPQDDKVAQGKAANAEKMNAAKPGEFNKAAFIAAVNAAIAKQAPKNLDDADKFGESGKADAVKGEVAGKVGDGKKASAGAIESTTKAPPDTAAAKDKPVTPLRPDQPPAKPGTPDPGLAVPDKAPAAATDFSEGPKQVNDEMAGAGVTEEQLAKSNEPEFTGALKEKKAGEQHAAAAPGEVRGKEAETLAGAKAQAGQAGAAAMTAMTAARGKSGKELDAGKGGAQSEEEQKRAQVTAKLQAVFDATKRDVEAILTGLDKKVDDQFTKGEKTARDAFTADHKRRMDAYKDKRYSGFTGKLKWVKDKFAGLPEEANQIFVTARQGYVTAMQGVISSVADTIGTELNAAKTRIAKGRTDLQAEVQKLPKDLQALGKEAAGEFAGKFDELTQSVDDKGTELVDTLASKYTEALKSVDEEIAAEKEKNKGLIAKAIDAVKGVIETIKNLANLLMGVLAKAAQAVAAIIKDPIGFLGKLVSAVGAGLKAFIGNIGAHLQKGLVSWLLGTAAKAGLQLPAKFDLKGILQLIASLLGLTWGAIRGRIVAKGVPEQAMGAVEAGVPLVSKIQNEGIGGLWEDIKDKIGDLKENLLAKISEYLIPTVLIAGITWIVSLLNPASAFIKACKAIIDIVTFIIERGAQILAFVNSVLDAVIAIAGGGAGGVPGLIETALANSIPVLIGFLAALLGIGGIADRVKKIFQALSKPVMKAVDWVVGKITVLGKKIWAKLKGKFGKKDKGANDPAAPGKKKDPRIRELVAADVNAALADGVADNKVKPALRTIFSQRRSQGLDMLEARTGSAPGQFDIYMAASPVTKIRATKVDPGNPEARKLVDAKGIPYSEFGFDIPRDAVLSGSFTLPVAGKPGGYGATRAIAELHTTSRVISYEKQTSKSSDVHAEDQVISEVKGSWDGLGSTQEETRPGKSRPDAALDLKVTRTPCPQCAGRLGSLRSWAHKRGWDLTIDVSSIGLYQGKAEFDDNAGKKEILRGIRLGKAGLLRLAEWGIKVRPMSVDDPAIKKNWENLDPKDQIALALKINAYHDRLRPAIDEIDATEVVLRSV